MKKSLFIVLILICSCAAAPQAYVDSINQGLEVLIPQHIKYLDADKNLTDTEREAMKKSAGEMLELSRTAVKEK